MTPTEVLIDMIEFNADWMRKAISEMSPELRRWQPDPEANNINVTVWQCGKELP